MPGDYLLQLASYVASGDVKTVQATLESWSQACLKQGSALSQLSDFAEDMAALLRRAVQLNDKTTQSQMVRMLIEYGADPNYNAEKFDTPVDILFCHDFYNKLLIDELWGTGARFAGALVPDSENELARQFLAEQAEQFRPRTPPPGVMSGVVGMHAPHSPSRDNHTIRQRSLPGTPDKSSAPTRLIF